MSLLERVAQPLQFDGFPPATVKVVREWLPAALTAIKRRTGRAVAARTIYAMTAKEIAADEKHVESGNPRGGGHGRNERDGTVKVNPRLSPYLTLLNVIHELGHGELPDADELEMDRVTKAILKEIGADAIDEEFETHSSTGKQTRPITGLVPLPLGRTPKKGEIINPEMFEGSMSLRDRVLAEAQDPAVETLYVFDMDDTLIHHPSKEGGMKKWKELTGKDWPYDSWWSIAQTLQAPFKFAAIAKTKSALKKARQDPKGKVVVMTGRIASPPMKKTIPKLLRSLGLGEFVFGETLFLKRLNARDTAAWKVKMIANFQARYPGLKRIEMWDDRVDHIPKFRAAIAKAGLEGKVTRVHEKPPAHIAASTSLRDRVVQEQFPNAPWWSMRKDPYEPHETPPKGKKSPPPPMVTGPEDEEQPIENPLPGNLNTRMSKRAQGTRLQRMREPSPRS